MWPGHQSGPNERKVELWAFASTKQSIILRNPFLHIGRSQGPGPGRENKACLSGLVSI